MRVVAVGEEAVGVFAFGQQATGVIAVGQLATGVIAIGQLARGGIVIGQLTLGVASFAQLGIGAVWSGGMLAVGGTSGVSLLGLGAMGRWVPWRRGSFERTRAAGWAMFVRIIVLAALFALVVAVAVIPLAEELRDLFSEPAAPPRLM